MYLSVHKFFIPQKKECNERITNIYFRGQYFYYLQKNKKNL